MKALHGPWKIESEQMCASVIDGDGDAVCYCDCGDAGQDEVNARAISAMPEALEALREAVAFYDKRLAEAKRTSIQMPSEMDEGELPSRSEATRRARARAALAKAEGA